MIRISDGIEDHPNEKNLETLGAARLAELLIEISTGSAVAKRRFRLALAGAQSPKEAGREVAKRLTSIARARSFVNWQNRKPLVTDLESQLRAIREQIAPADPAGALALAWRFMQVAMPLFARCDDSSGTVIGAFHDACAMLGEVALAAGPPPEALADAAIEALRDNGYGQYDGLIAILTPALGAEGLAHLSRLRKIRLLGFDGRRKSAKRSYECGGFCINCRACGWCAHRCPAGRRTDRNAA